MPQTQSVNREQSEQVQGHSRPGTSGTSEAQGHKRLPLRKEPGHFGSLPEPIDLYRLDCECGWGSMWQENPQFVRDAHTRHVERQTHASQVLGL